jgi:hypothetical protein
LNIYEIGRIKINIGGGISNINLLSTLINDKNIKNTLILLLLDLSNPSKVIETMHSWLNSIKSIIKDKISSELIKDILENKKTKYEKQNIDLNNFVPCEMTLLFTKYENFENLDM